MTLYSFLFLPVTSDKLAPNFFFTTLIYHGFLMKTILTTDHACQCMCSQSSIFFTHPEMNMSVLILSSFVSHLHSHVLHTASSRGYQEMPSPSCWLPQIPEVNSMPVSQLGAAQQKPHQSWYLARCLFSTSTIQPFSSLHILLFVTGRRLLYVYGKDYDTSTHINRQGSSQGDKQLHVCVTSYS